KYFRLDRRCPGRVIMWQHDQQQIFLPEEMVADCMVAMNTTPESEQLQKALTELATAMTRIVCTRVDQAVAEIMVGKLPSGAGSGGQDHTGGRPAYPAMAEIKPAAAEEGFISKP